MIPFEGHFTLYKRGKRSQDIAMQTRTHCIRNKQAYHLTSGGTSITSHYSLVQKINFCTQLLTTLPDTNIDMIFITFAPETAESDPTFPVRRQGAPIRVGQPNNPRALCLLFTLGCATCFCKSRRHLWADLPAVTVKDVVIVTSDGTG